MIFENEYVNCSAQIDDNLVKLQGQILMKPFARAEIFAPNPIDRMVNYSGSGLPFPCSQIAFEGTPNYFVTTDPSGSFSVTFKYPNSYYTEDQWTRIPPSIFFKIFSADAGQDPVFVRFALPNPDILNVRTLNFRTKLRAGPPSYSIKEDIIPICGAEETMRRYRDLKIQQDYA